MTPMQKFETARDKYLDNLRFSERSENTVKNYETRLNAFLGFWSSISGENGPDTDPDYSTVEAWRTSLVKSGAAASTVKQYLLELSQFFRAFQKPIFGKTLQYAENPVAEEFYPKVHKKPYDQILTDEQVLRLIPDRCPSPQAKPTWARNYAIIALLLTSKIRNSELRALTPADLDWEYGEITVEHGKGDKFRVVEFTPFAQSAMRLYLQSGIRPAGLSDRDPLFGTTATADFGEFGKSGKWHAGSRQWLSEVVERHVYSLTGVHDVRSHDLRHVGARLNLNAGASLEQLQSELGHASMATTQIYSGMLLQRRGRNSARQVAAAMDEQAQKNDAKFDLRQPPVKTAV